jgi:hypothetical protein
MGKKCSIRQGNNDLRRSYTKIILDPEEQGRKKRWRRVIKFRR